MLIPWFLCPLNFTLHMAAQTDFVKVSDEFHGWLSENMARTVPRAWVRKKDFLEQNYQHKKRPEFTSRAERTAQVELLQAKEDPTTTTSSTVTSSSPTNRVFQPLFTWTWPWLYIRHAVCIQLRMQRQKRSLRSSSQDEVSPVQMSAWVF
jgi:hypothetical protein